MKRDKPGSSFLTSVSSSLNLYFSSSSRTRENLRLIDFRYQTQKCCVPPKSFVYQFSSLLISIAKFKRFIELFKGLPCAVFETALSCRIFGDFCYVTNLSIIFINYDTKMRKVYNSINNLPTSIYLRIIVTVLQLISTLDPGYYLYQRLSVACNDM